MSKIIKKYFFFARHAETDWNHQKLCQGQHDVPLNERGSQEAKRLATRSLTLNIDCVVTSPLSRALETAREIHDVHSHAHFHVVPELSERCWGLLEGISSEEMYAIERLEERDPSYVPGNGVETRKAFRERVSKGIKIAQTYHQHPLIISHGRVFTELCNILGIPPVRQIPNCQLVKISTNDKGWEAHII
jgi:broad specificity phosphatase PhoE